MLSCRTFRRRNRAAAALAVAALGGLGAAASADAAVFNVMNRADAGAGSLRDAITNANAAAGADEIHFSIPGAGPVRHVIHLASDLPAVTDTIDIRGYSQPGATKAVVGAPALIKIVIDAQQAANGLVLQTDGSLVRGLVVHTAGGAAPDGVGIRVEGDGNRLEGNYLGLDGTNNNTFLFGNQGDGVQIIGDENVVGGAAAEDRNVITANGKIAGTIADGVSLDGDGNKVKGNAIGTDPTMTNGQIGNHDAGVRVAGDDNQVGGQSLGSGNVIAGNATAVQVDSGTGNAVLGNLIGTDSTGTLALGNSHGVVLDAPGSRVGGTTGFEANVIAGTTVGAGVEVNSDDNVVQGNRVGTDAFGGAALQNLGGISVAGDGNTIGGVAAGAPNLVSGNFFYGIRLAGDDNRVQANLVGTDAAGVAPIGNTGDGIEVIGTAADNTIGGLVPGVANTVAFNDGDGVAVESGTANTVTRNAISDNTGLGIDLAQDDVTLNDVGFHDADAGANGLLNFPELGGARTIAGVSTVDWSVDDGLPFTRLRIDFYGNGACDASGHGEGETYLGTAFATTDVNGDITARTTTMINSAAVGQQVAATATVAPLVLPPDAGETSELSLCELVV
jgi:hypothetical protein